MQSASATKPVYLYMFERETPVEGGRMHCPHTSEVPFIFGTTAAAKAQAGTGNDIAPLDREHDGDLGCVRTDGKSQQPQPA